MLSDMNTIEILTAVLALITGLYVLFSFFILLANRKAVAIMKQQVETIQRPYITIRTSSDSNMIQLIVSNTGKSAASKLRLEVDRNFYRYGNKKEDKNLNNLFVFKEEIEGFPPGLTLKFTLVEGFKIFGPQFNAELTPLVFNIKATYYYLNKKFIENTPIDLRSYDQSLIITDPIASQIKRIYNHLKIINSTVAHLPSSFAHFKNKEK